MQSINYHHMKNKEKNTSGKKRRKSSDIEITELFMAKKWQERLGSLLSRDNSINA